MRTQIGGTSEIQKKKGFFFCISEVCTTFVGTITILEKQTTKLYGNNNYY